MADEHDYTAEYNALVREYNYEIQRQAELQAELEVLIDNVYTLASNTGVVSAAVDRKLAGVSNRLSVVEDDTTELFLLVDELTRTFFTYKNMSSASKNLSQLTDQYYTNYRFFNELRRISLGFIIGVDAHICSDEMMRKKVEKVYLQNTEYWLAYAIMAVMLWVNNIKEAATRALNKAMYLDHSKSSLFFLLVNLRFNRIEAAKKWYTTYLDRANMDNLGEEWQYLLEAYLLGVFGVDEDFNRTVVECFEEMFEQFKAKHPNFGNEVIHKAAKFSENYVHVTRNNFDMLRMHCHEYETMEQLLSNAEKNEKLAIYFRSTLEDDSGYEPNVHQRIENILYDLINSYDTEEFKVVKNIRYNDMVIRARGNLTEAQKFYNKDYPKDNDNTTLGDLLFYWTFEEDLTQVDISVKKFSISYLKKWLGLGFAKFAENYREKEQERYTIKIEDWSMRCSEDSYDEANASLTQHFNKNRLWTILKDKMMLIFIGMCIASIVTLAITIFHFSPIPLTIGVMLGVIGGFLVWRRAVEIIAIIEAKCEEARSILKKCLTDMASWRALYREADAKNKDLVEVFEDVEY